MKYVEATKIKNDPSLYEGIDESASWVMREPFIFDYFKDNVKVNNKILDFGCGNGVFLDKLKEMGYKNLYGADIANYLKNKEYEFQVVDMNKENFKWEDNFFDVITAFQVLEHLENYFLIIQEASRVLKPGGLFIFSVPNQFNIFYRMKFLLTGNITGWELNNNHLLFLTKDVFKKTFLKDFDLVHTHGNKGPVPMLGRLNILPGVKFPAKTRMMLRGELWSDKICYVLKKK